MNKVMRFWGGVGRVGRFVCVPSIGAQPHPPACKRKCEYTCNSSRQVNAVHVLCTNAYIIINVSTRLDSTGVMMVCVVVCAHIPSVRESRTPPMGCVKEEGH
jgi:hypothetical protein